MKRIAVLGSPGAGKSTLCERLSKKTSLPIYHIDEIYLEKPDYWDTHQEELKNIVLKIIKKDRWIIDGNYSSTFKERFARADLVIFLDVPLWVAYKGVIQRRIKYHKKERPGMPNGWAEQITVDFLKFVWDFNKTKKQNIKNELAKLPSEKVQIFTSRRQAKAYIDKL